MEARTKLISTQPTERIAGLVLAFVACLATIGFVALASWMVSSDVVNFQGVEINVVFTIQKFLLGSPLYTSPALPPFDVAQYTPLYYWMVALIARAAGATGTDPALVARSGRAISSVFTLGSLAVLYRVFRESGAVSRAHALIAIAFVIAATFPWLILARPDALATLLSLAAVYLLLRDSSDGDRQLSRYVLSVLFAGAAIAAKQNAIVPLILTLVVPAFEKNWRHVLVWVLIAATAAIVVTVFVLSTPFLRENIVEGVNNGIDLEWAVLHSYRFLYVWCLPLVAGLAATLLSWKRNWTRGRRILAAGAAAYLGTALAFSLKWGSAPNYFVEFVFLAVAVILGGWKSLDGRFAPHVLRPALMLYATAFIVLRLVNQSSTYLPLARVTTGTFSGWDRILARVDSIPPDTYVVGLDLGFAARRPQAALLPSPEIADRAFKRGVVDYSCFQSLVRSGRVRYLVTIAGWMPPVLLGADLSQFKRVAEIDGHWVSASSLSAPPLSTELCR